MVPYNAPTRSRVLGVRAPRSPVRQQSITSEKLVSSVNTLPSPALSRLLCPVLRWQEGLIALEALLRRRMGVDTWTIEDVVSWLRDVGLWSENTEREVRLARSLFSQAQPSPLRYAFILQAQLIAMKTAAQKHTRSTRSEVLGSL